MHSTFQIDQALPERKLGRRVALDSPQRVRAARTVSRCRAALKLQRRGLDVPDIIKPSCH